MLIQEDIASDNSEWRSLMAAVWMSIFLMIIEFIGLFGGFTLFHHTNNIFYISIHSVGIIFTALFVALLWPYWIFWFIFLICSLISGITEMVSILKIVICQTRKY